MADFAYYQINVDEKARTITFMRLADPHHRNSLLYAVGYVDGDELEKLAAASVTAKDDKCVRIPTPAAEALAIAGITTLVNKHTYVIKY